MTIENGVMVESMLLEFKIWLDIHRIEINKILRKYSAIRNYLITISLGSLIFIVDDWSSESALIKSSLIFFMLILMLFSSQIAYWTSGADKLLDQRVFKLEKSIHWFKEIDIVLGSECYLLNDYYVAKTTKLSKKEKFDFFYYSKSMILIADSI